MVMQVEQLLAYRQLGVKTLDEALNPNIICVVAHLSLLGGQADRYEVDKKNREMAEQQRKQKVGSTCAVSPTREG